MKTDNHKTVAMEIMLLLVAVIWGLNYVIVKISLKEMDPLIFNTARFAIGALVCWLILLIRERDYRLTADEIKKILILGIGVHALNQVTFVYGVARTTAATASIILATTPAWVSLFASGLKLDQYNPKIFIGIILSFLGTVFVVLNFGSVSVFSAGFLQGNILILLATIFWSLYTILVRLFFADMSAAKITAYSLTSTALFFAFISLPKLLAAPWSEFSPQAWLGMLYSGIFVFGISYVLWNSGIKAVGPTRTSVYANLPPFVSILFGRLLLGERIGLLQVFGGILILLGLNIVNRVKISLVAAESSHQIG